MITLATLGKATPQEVFNQGAKHLMEQGCKASTKDIDCAYRGDNGTKCLAGCFISDEEYNPKMENRIFCVVWEKLGHIITKGSETLDLMQPVHDENDPEDWKDKLTEFAEKRGLSTEVLG